jgi:4-hydroxybenzoate polyprenyltransferase
MGIPLIYARVSIGTGLAVGAWVFIQYFIDCSVYDMRDIEGDKVNGVRTLPVVLGPGKTTALLVGFNSMLIALVPLIKVPILALAMTTCRFIYIPYFSQRRDLLSMDVLVVLAVFYLLGIGL